MTGWRIFTFIWMLCITVAVITLYNDYNFVDPALYKTVEKDGGNDTLKVAVQLGRFDLVSMLLAIVTLLIGIFAVSGFWMIRGAAIKAAEEAALAEAKKQSEATAKETAEKIARAYLEEKTPELVENMLKSMGELVPPKIGLTAEQIQNVTSGSVEIGGNQNGNG